MRLASKAAIVTGGGSGFGAGIVLSSLAASRKQSSPWPSFFWSGRLEWSPMDKTSRSSSAGAPGHWVLQDAKARFSELVRRVRSEGPQHVTVHGRDEVVVIAAEEFRRLQGARTGRSLVDAIQSSPHRDIDIDVARAPMPVRDVAL